MWVALKVVTDISATACGGRRSASPVKPGVEAVKEVLDAYLLCANKMTAQNGLYSTIATAVEANVAEILRVSRIWAFFYTLVNRHRQS